MIKNIVGFTLIELMLALAISVILVTIGYPTYTHYQTHAQRNRAQAALMQLAAKLELYFNDNGTYAGATLASLHATQLTQGILYQLKIQAGDAHFEIEAIPQEAQANRDTRCGTLTLTDTNQRGADGDVNTCWS